MIRLIREDRRRVFFIAFGAIFCMVLGFIILNMRKAAADSPDDVSSAVNWKLNEMSVTRDNNKQMIISDGQKVPGAPSVKVGDLVFIDFKWEVPFNNISNIKAGKYFFIPLPDSEVFNIRNTQGEEVVVNKDGQDIRIGTFDIEDDGKGGKRLRIKFKRSDFDELKNVHIGLSFTISKPKDKVIITPGNKDDSVEVGIKDRDWFNPNEGFEPENFPPIYEHQKTIYKWGKGAEITGDEIPYCIAANRDDLLNIFKDSGKRKTKHGMYIIDELPDGLSFKRRKDKSLIEVVVPVYAPAIDRKTGKLLNTTSDKWAIFWGALTFKKDANGHGLYFSSGKKGFDYVEDSQGEKTWKEFKDSVLKAEKPTVGIWKYHKLVISLGDLPGQHFHYNDIYATRDQFIHAIDNQVIEHDQYSPLIRKDQAEAMKKAYVDKPVASFLIYFDAKIIGKAKKTYVNIAEAVWDNNTVEKGKAKDNTATSRSRGEANTFNGNFEIVKEWVGEKGNDVTVRLLADGVPAYSNGRECVAVLGDGNGWKHTFTGLQKFNHDTRKDYKYTLVEDPVRGYESVIEKRGEAAFDVYNVELMNLKVTKKWNGSVGASVRFDVLKDGVKVGDTHVLNASNNWTFEVRGLKKFERKADGDWKEIEYSVKELPMPNYKSEVRKISASEFEIINTELTSVKVRKVWKNPDGTVLGGNGFDPVKVILYKNGSTDPFKTVEISHAMGWEYTFENLQKYENGNLIQYTVQEEPVPGFIEEVSGNANAGFVITNTRNIAEKPDIILKEEPFDTAPDALVSYISFDYKKKPQAEKLANGNIKIYFKLKDRNNPGRNFNFDKKILMKYAISNAPAGEEDRFNNNVVTKAHDPADRVEKADGYTRLDPDNYYYIEVPASVLKEKEASVNIIFTAKTEIRVHKRGGGLHNPYFSEEAVKKFRIQRRDLFDLE